MKFVSKTYCENFENVVFTRYVSASSLAVPVTSTRVESVCLPRRECTGVRGERFDNRCTRKCTRARVADTINDGRNIVIERCARPLVSTRPRGFCGPRFRQQRFRKTVGFTADRRFDAYYYYFYRNYDKMYKYSVQYGRSITFVT